jgi:hypothetical protein
MTEADNQVLEFNVTALASWFFGTICAIMAFSAGPAKARIMPVQKMTK